MDFAEKFDKILNPKKAPKTNNQHDNELGSSQQRNSEAQHKAQPEKQDFPVLNEMIKAYNDTHYYKKEKSTDQEPQNSTDQESKEPNDQESQKQTDQEPKKSNDQESQKQTDQEP
jgi:hypothetical protein